MRRFLMCCVLGLCTGLPAAWADAATAAEPRTMCYVVRHAPAADLAKALSQAFADRSDLKVVAEPVSNCLLVTGDPETLTGLVRILQELDRAPRQIAVEITLVELKSDARLADAAEGTDLAAALAEWEKQDKLHVLNRARLTVLENQRSTLQLGERAPVASGRSVPPAAGGRAFSSASSYTYHDVGTLVSVSARGTGDDSIALSLEFEKSRLVAAPVETGGEEAGREGPPPRTVTTTIRTTLTIDGGRTLLAGSMQSASEGEASRLLLLFASAKVVAPTH